jgi:cellulose synthase/poly-beta-1,6-N-acetylglucosamine synthase-like glycosyltransferase
VTTALRAEPAPLLDTAEVQRVARQPFLTPVLSFGQDAVLRVLGLAWLLTSLLFWLWWLAPARGDWTLARAIATAGLGWVFLLGGYFVAFSSRMTRPNPGLPLPSLRVAMIVTKAPAEPWPMLEKTLRAMLAQDIPYEYDVWLADERPSGKTLRWCRTHGVQVSTRQWDPRYHQATWPRRTKTKEGNLAYFYDHFGYRRYDVVVQLDADHVPAPTYLRAMVRPFADPGVGYVAAPSVCDANADQGWTVRGRLHREASLHGPVQSGSNNGWGVLCFGSHYAVRTAALKEVGGLGPELAEDYATTLWLQSAGWQGVFAIDAEAHGDGPETFDDLITQELQWSRSLGTLLTKWAPAKLRTVPWRARARLAFALLFYLVQGIVCVSSVVLPSIGVLTGFTWVQTSFADFYLRMWLPSSCLLLVVWWLRRCAALRPTTARLWSMDLALFQLVRWPWTTWGFFQGMWAGRREVPKPYRVTPKGDKGLRPLSLRLLAPMLALALVPVLVIEVAPDPQAAPGLAMLLMMQTIVYIGAAGIVIARHIEANARRRSGDPHNQPRLITWSTGGSALLATSVTAVVGTSLLVAQVLSW